MERPLLDASALAHSLSESLNHLTEADNEAVAVGSSTNNRMTVVRRNFALFVLFDLLIIFFIWLTLQMLTGDGNFISIFNREIVHFNFKVATFDIVVIAFLRFFVLLTAYAVFKLDWKLFVALTTTGTCVFLILKVVYYQWQSNPMGALHGLTLLASFCLAWAEVWWFDMRVVPLEEQAREAVVRSNENKRLVQRYLANLTSTHSETNYATPLPEPEDGCENPREELALLIDPEERDWVTQGMSALREAALLVARRDNWKKSLEKDGTVVSVGQFQNLTYFKFETVFKATPDSVINLLYEDFQDVDKWNPTLEECTPIKKLTRFSDIIHQVSKKKFSVSARDMTLVRRLGIMDDYLAIAYKSISHPDFPPRHNVCRMSCGASCWAVRPFDRRGNCQLLGLMNVDPKVNVPQLFLKNAMCASLVEVSGAIKSTASRWESVESG